MSPPAEELTSWSAASMAGAIRVGSISPIELVDAHLARIAALDEAVNAIVVSNAEGAAEAARHAERERDRGRPLGPLHGVPFTVKECLEVEGLALCEGSRLRHRRRSKRDAAVVARLRAAGAIPLGKTNLSELASFPDTTNLVYGATCNPHDRTLSASGSSGGEAAAVATGMSPLGIGADYGGSIRGPAHATGIVGLRPGRGTVPLSGHAPTRLPPGRALWQTIGPLTRTVEDAALLLSIIRGDRGGHGSPPPNNANSPRPVIVIRDDAARPLTPECEGAVERAAATLAATGHDVDEARPPRQADAEWMFNEVTTVEAWFTIRSLLTNAGIHKRDRWSSDAHGGLDRAATERTRLALERTEASLSPQLALQWSAVRDLSFDLERYLGALSLRIELEHEVDSWLERHPILLAPVAATPAYPKGALEAEVRGRSRSIPDLYASCTYASALGLPAAAVPTARTAQGLPVAVQVIGRRGRGTEVLAVARELEVALGGWCRPSLPDSGERS